MENGNALTVKDKWEAKWDGTRIPVTVKPVYDLRRQLNAYLPIGNRYSLIEIGCAPGGWMAFFSKNFGFHVAGIEYAEVAAEVTKKNMKLLRIDASVLVQDFLTFDCSGHSYDIVFSAGFIEHFENVSVVIEKLIGLSKKYVVSIVPNIYGINGFISKTMRPKVYAEHIAIDAQFLENMHKGFGLATMFCDYVGGARFIMPGANSHFYKRFKIFADTINVPFKVFNRFSEISQEMGLPAIRSRFFSNSLLYIGIKQ